jgi:hypothetical protein
VQKFGVNVTTSTADLSLGSGQIKVYEFSYTPVAEAQIEVAPWLPYSLKALVLLLSLETSSHILTIRFPLAQISATLSDSSWVTEG